MIIKEGYVRKFLNSGKVSREESIWEKLDNFADTLEIPIALGGTVVTVSTYGVGSAWPAKYKSGGEIKRRFAFKKSSLVKDAEKTNGRDMRKKLVKSDVVTNKKKRITKGQLGLKFVEFTPAELPEYETLQTSPFSEFNFPVSRRREILEEPVDTALQILEVLQVPERTVKDDTKALEKKVTTRPVTASNHKYTDRSKWVSDLKAAYIKAGITNENALRMLIAQDALESGWGRSAQGHFNYGNLTQGKSWKGPVVNGRDSDGKGNPITLKFRSYSSMEEYAADKVQFLKTLYDFDENDDINMFTKKLLGGNKGKRRYAGDPNYILSVTKIYNTSKI